MFIDLFSYEQLVKHLEFRVVIMAYLFDVGLLWSTFYETSLMFSVFYTSLGLPVVAAALPIALLIFLDSITMLLIIMFLLIITRFKSSYNGLRPHSFRIAIQSNPRCKLRFLYILYLEVTLLLDDLFLVSSSSFLWHWALYHVMAAHMVEFALWWMFIRLHRILLVGIQRPGWDISLEFLFLAVCPLGTLYRFAESINFHLRDIGIWWAFTIHSWSRFRLSQAKKALASRLWLHLLRFLIFHLFLVEELRLNVGSATATSTQRPEVINEFFFNFKEADFIV